VQLLQVAAYLRRTGFFVVAALTRPFEFEGRRKLEEADALIEALQDVAQLVVRSCSGSLAWLVNLLREHCGHGRSRSAACTHASGHEPGLHAFRQLGIHHIVVCPLLALILLLCACCCCAGGGASGCANPRLC
jgi:hypothetical protein